MSDITGKGPGELDQDDLDPDGAVDDADGVKPRNFAAATLRGLRNLGMFVVYVTNRFIDDGGTTSAASLAFSFLLALVPLIAIAVTILTGFAVFEDAQAQLQEFVLANFVPEFGNQVSEYVADYIGNTGGLPAVGVVALAVTSVLLVINIESAFNRVWRVGESRSLAIRILTGWTVITLGPLLLGASLSLSSDAFTMLTDGAKSMEPIVIPDVDRGWFVETLIYIMPAVLSVAGFTLLNKILPNCTVPWLHAFIGGVFTAVAFALLRETFTAYLIKPELYETIYSTIFILPLLLMWTYFAWVVILIGACIASSLGNWRVAIGDSTMLETNPTRILRSATAVLSVLLRAAKVGKPMKRFRLERRAMLAPGEVEPVLQRLRNAGYVTKAGRDKWVLCRDLSEATLRDLLHDMKISVDPKDAHVRGLWPGEMENTIHHANLSAQTMMTRDIKSILLGIGPDVSEVEANGAVPLRRA